MLWAAVVGVKDSERDATNGLVVETEAIAATALERLANECIAVWLKQGQPL